MSFKSLLKREFSIRAMRAREERYYVVEEVKDFLQLWKDYGDPEDLTEAVKILENQRSGLTVD